MIAEAEFQYKNCLSHSILGYWTLSFREVVFYFKTPICRQQHGPRVESVILLKPDDIEKAEEVVRTAGGGFLVIAHLQNHLFYIDPSSVCGIVPSTYQA